MNSSLNPRLRQWQPSASLKNLKMRARILGDIRQFFHERGVMEVDTPSMSQACVSDVHLSSFETLLRGPAAPAGQRLYLQTSPEFHMKRLLAAGSGCIYQLAKAFRNEEAGRHHNPEFTMLEWYRINFDADKLMTEVDDLVGKVLKTPAAVRVSYRQAFFTHLGVDPIDASTEELLEASIPLGVEDLVAKETNRDTVLQLLFSLGVEPHIGQDKPCFIYHFPATQAALARICEDDPQVSERFELYYRGMELANGFYELSDAEEQAQRFAADQRYRAEVGLPEAEIDQHFLDALQAGLPDCAGVALGIDRLLILACDAEHIKDVLSFDVARA
ncbi:elongation factor P--(R)-beta-lysine ligase [Aliagarivorans taiwanensis]|uniref:elongation factor P--(R)-beta-lysine ligase n=1 Tax=Aliagarivorans taiwanensis TaxID=561966 RepID=UPI00047AB115|nr:elongation factor P--(R)-beta-lysine ligase [Aliagarivorans taiwanensis]